MISAIVVIGLDNEILLHRFYRNDLHGNEVMLYVKQLMKSVITHPIHRIGNCTFFTSPCGTLRLVAVSKTNSNAALVFDFLRRVSDAILGLVDPKGTKAGLMKDPSLVFELFDEMCDNGVPQLMDIKSIKAVLSADVDEKQEPIEKLTAQVTGAQTWRNPHAMYDKQEVFVDVVETVNALVCHDGQFMQHDVTGCVIFDSRLSGIPECHFGADEAFLKYINGSQRTNCDIKFHPCVRVNKFQKDSTISFIPPDGTFQLMSYRISDLPGPLFRIIPTVKLRGKTRLDVALEVVSLYPKSTYAVNLRFKIPVPVTATSIKIKKLYTGKLKLEPSESCVSWRINRLNGGNRMFLNAEVILVNTGEIPKWSRSPIIVQFEMPMFSLSGLSCRYLRVQERTSVAKVVKWVRYLTQSGSYMQRI